MEDTGVQEVEVRLGEEAPMVFAGKKKKRRRKEPAFLAELDAEIAAGGVGGPGREPGVVGGLGRSAEETERVISAPETPPDGGSGLGWVRGTESSEERAQRVTPEWQEYEYSDLLERIFVRTRKRGGAVGGAGGSGSRCVLDPVQVIKLGTKKSGFVNFGKIVGQMRRDPGHVKRFMEVELGTSGTLDGLGYLVFKGKFGRGEVEAVLRRYIREYLRCRTCSGYSTRLEKDKATRLTFMVCDGCSARSTAGTIEDGFSALTEKRSRVRRREGN